VHEMIVFNKVDAIDEHASRRLHALHPEASFISALTGEGVDAMLEAVVSGISARSIELDLVIPYDRGDILAEAHASGEVVSQRHGDSGTAVTVRLPHEIAGRFRPYVTEG